jgi:transposase
VIDVARETDIERLRQAALLLQYENDHLYRRLEKLVRALAEASGDKAYSLQLEIKHLSEKLAKRNRELYGKSSERRPRGENDAGENKGADDKSERRGHGPSAQPDLRIDEVVCHLEEADKTCPCCGGGLEPMDSQFEESEEIDAVERTFRILKIKRQKYRCGCGNVIETAPGPPKLIAGGRYSVGLAVGVAIAKYLEHMPLARQERQMQRLGLKVGRQALWDQLLALSGHLLATYEALHRYVLEASVIGADETTWRLMDAGGSTRWWTWSVVREDAVYYRIDKERSADAAGKIIANFNGTVICDALSSYKTLSGRRQASRDGPASFTLAHCWAHARRKFVEAEPAYPQAAEVLELIGDLYKVEARAKETANGDLHARRAELRQAESVAIVDEIRQWMLAQRALPSSTLGGAIGYAMGIWEGLCRFLEDPAVAVDNNAAERVMRVVALGRRNHYGSRSERGTRVAALFYSLLESAKLTGIEPAGYLHEAAVRAIAVPGTVTLPRDLADNS